MLKDNSHHSLIFIFVMYWVSKPIKKSIDRYWHKMNRIRRKNKWVPIYMEIPLFEGSDRVVRVETGRKRFIEKNRKC